MLETSRQRALAGIALKLGAVVAMGLMFAMVKLAVEAGVHSLEALFFRNLFAILPIAGYIAWTRRWSLLATRRPLGHLARGAMGVTAMACGFMAVAYMPLAEFTAINFAAPLFITALSVPVLRERVGPHRWAAVAVGFVGVLIMVRPDPVQFVGLGAGLALGSALGTAGAMLAIRQIGATEPGPTIAFYFTLFATAVGAASLPFVWSSPSLPTLGVLVACGVFGGIGQLLLTQAFRIAPAAVVAPFEYAALLWTGLLGYLLWQEVPSFTTLLGGAVVIASGLYIFWREMRLRSREPR